MKHVAITTLLVLGSSLLGKIDSFLSLYRCIDFEQNISLQNNTLSCFIKFDKNIYSAEPTDLCYLFNIIATLIQNLSFVWLHSIFDCLVVQSEQWIKVKPGEVPENAVAYKPRGKSSKAFFCSTLDKNTVRNEY